MNQTFFVKTNFWLGFCFFAGLSILGVGCGALFDLYNLMFFFVDIAKTAAH